MEYPMMLLSPKQRKNGNYYIPMPSRTVTINLSKNQMDLVCKDGDMAIEIFKQFRKRVNKARREAKRLTR